MKIQKIIFCCDMNPHYTGFWKSISRHNKEFLGIESRLICIGDEKNSLFSEDFGEVTYVPKLKNYPSILQALWGKFYFTKLEPETIWMIGDLDLYPLQKDWFIKNIETYPENSYLHLNSGGYGPDWNTTSEIHPGIPGYYHIAKGSTFQEVYDFKESFEEEIAKIYNEKKYGIQYHGAQAGEVSRASNPDTWGWFCAEEHYSKEVLLKKKQNVINVSTIHPGGRIDRYNGCSYDEEKLKNHFYVDMHSMRPYESHVDHIEKILQITKG